MRLPWKNFSVDELGAITVDWVVLTAAIIGIGMLVLMPIAFATDSTSNKVRDNISGINSGYGNN